MYEKLVADVHFMNGEYERAANMYLDGARNGDPLAAFNYAYCLQKGLGVQKNLSEAKSFYSFARDIEGGEAAYNLAVMYIHGDGVKKNYRTAMEYMRTSASRGCTEAQLYLGVAHTLGAVFDPDITGICMIPFHKSEYAMEDNLLIGDVEDLDADAEARYRAIPQDQHAAFEYFRAASRNDPTYVGDLVAKGKFLYAQCYVDGLGVDIDTRKAARLMLSAAQSGSSEAKDFLAQCGYKGFLADKK